MPGAWHRVLFWESVGVKFLHATRLYDDFNFSLIIFNNLHDNHNDGHLQPRFPVCDLRTLKEQGVFGRIFCYQKEVSQAVSSFVATYIRKLRLKKLDFLSPKEYQEMYWQKMAA